MPRPTSLPTPGSSADIKGKEGPQLGVLQMAFELPPPAITRTDSTPSSVSAKSSSASSYHPTSPRSPVVEKKNSAKPRRRFSAEKAAKDAFALPPPPARSRKIIQMKPRAQVEEKVDENKDISETKEVGDTKSSAPQGKRKPPSATSVAGRKIARKTAHSLIERRRRSKMNEEFGVLKDMIPACTGEMHKLAILQASIDYVRYLEDCVAKLKAQNTRRTPTPNSEHAHMPPPPEVREAFNSNYASYDEDDENEASDVEMNGTTYPAPHSHQLSASPAMQPQDSVQRNNSYSSASASTSIDSRHYSYSTSPNFGPQNYEYAISNASANSALTSPALLPKREEGAGSGAFGRDLDHEAMAALLMLNTDRRSTNRGGGGRGMSVKDLLSA